MDDLAIERVRVYAIGPSGPHDRWSADMPPQYVTLTLIRIETRGGIEGVGAEMAYGGRGFDGAMAESFRHIAPALLGASALDRAPIRAKLLHEGGGASSQALGMIDVALWDIAGRHHNLPVWRLLGGASNHIASYASTNTFDDVPAYLDHVDELLAQGFFAIKFHCWCIYERDRALVEAVAKRHGTKLKLMIDAEQMYSREDALAMASLLEDLGYEWFEAPLPDADLEGYADLRRRTSVPILPAGNTIVALPLLEQGLRMGAWSAVRVAATRVGGIGQAAKAVALAEAHGVTAELQSWGYTPIQAANLHVMLGLGNCRYFEQPVPYNYLEYGVRNPIRTDKTGHVRAPDGPGLGIDVDWPQMERAAFLTIDARA
jgi:L-alanine-DL-glutamate epimerase-like enolase superfamily enzyme